MSILQATSKEFDSFLIIEISLFTELELFTRLDDP